MMSFFEFLLSSGYEDDDAKEVIRRTNSFKETAEDELIKQRYSAYMRNMDGIYNGIDKKPEAKSTKAVVFGYCRVSTTTQDINRQIRNIKAAYPGAVIVQEAYTGTKMNRPEWNKLYTRAKAGDTIVFDSVSRMSRNADEGIDVYFELYERGVSLVFLKEAYINTETYKQSINKALEPTGNEIADVFLEAANTVFAILARQQIKIAFDQAQKEVDDLRARTKEGIETARLNGKQIGRRSGAVKGGEEVGNSFKEYAKTTRAKQIIKQHSKDFGGSLSDSEVIKLAGCARGSYYKYKRELKAQI